MGQRRPSAWRRHGAQDGVPGGCTRPCVACARPLPRGWPVLLSSPTIVAAWRRPPSGAPAGPRCPGRMRSGWPFKAHDACFGRVRARWPSGTLGLRGVARAFSRVYRTVRREGFLLGSHIKFLHAGTRGRPRDARWHDARWSPRATRARAQRSAPPARSRRARAEHESTRRRGGESLRLACRHADVARRLPDAPGAPSDLPDTSSPPQTRTDPICYTNYGQHAPCRP